MSDVHLEYINDVFLKVKTDPGILMELAEKFTFKAPNYKFHPKYKAGVWTGDISLVNRLNGAVRAGLAKRIKKYCDQEGYSFTFDDELFYEDVSKEEVESFLKHLDLPEWVEIRDYQIESLHECVRSRRRTLLSPTSSGKSLMIYFLHMWFEKKTLIIVPSNGLVEQFESDLRSYGFNGKIHTSIGGLSKDSNIDADIVISTWQSLDNGKNRMPKEWYSQFKHVVGDECHGAPAACLTRIMESMTNTPYRFGTTGTLGEDNLTHLTVEGLFGPQYKSITTRELIDQGYATNLIIKAIVLKYPDSVKKEFHKGILDPKTNKYRKRTYQEEIEFINTYDPRVKLIADLTKSLKGNKLLFFRIIEYGKKLYESLKDRPDVFYIDGGVKNREEIRVAIEDHEDATLIASVGTTATGISIRKLHHMISAAPMKGSIRLLQAIGRMLRQHESKSKAYMYDIVDDITWKKAKNFAFKHFEVRASIYDKEKFDYRIYEVNL
jgi:superfamily II DNA or RNA helicase